MKKARTNFVSCLIMFSLIGLSINSIFGQTDEVLNLNFTVEDAFSPNSEVIDYFIFNGMENVNHQSFKPATLEAFNYRMDSIIFEGYHPGNDKWDAENKSGFRYDSKGNVTEYIEYKMDEGNGKWRADKRRTYSYDAFNQVTDFITYSCYSCYYYNEAVASKWLREERKAYVYDTYGTLRKITTYLWNRELSTWLPEYRVFYNYNRVGEIISITTSTENQPASKWINDYQISYTYDLDGMRSHMIYAKWNERAEFWAIHHIFDYLFDAKGNMVEVVGYEPIIDIGNWVLDFKRVYAYDDVANLTRIINYRPAGADSKLIEDYMFEYAYDVKGNKTEFVSSTWDGTDHKWVGIKKMNFTYDLSHDVNTVIMPHAIYIPGNKNMETLTGMLVTYNSFYNDVKSTSGFYDNWVSDHKGATHFTKLKVPTSFTASPIEVQVYPNPINDFVTFKVEDPGIPTTVKLYDANGKMVLSDDVINYRMIDVSHLRSGIYIWNIIQNGKMEMGKITIQ